MLCDEILHGSGGMYDRGIGANVTHLFHHLGAWNQNLAISWK
jgi:hypothetical protein